MGRPRLLLASANQGKLRELRAILGGLPVELVGLDDAGTGEPPEVEETGETFLENALLKARAYAAWSGLAAVADDSGLEVDALGGAPGVRSARYGSPELCAGPADVTLESLRFRRNAKLVYVDDMGDWWAHEVRVEDRLAAEDRLEHEAVPARKPVLVLVGHHPSQPIARLHPHTSSARRGSPEMGSAAG